MSRRKTRRKGFGRQLRPAEVQALILTCLPFLTFEDMQQECGWLLWHYVRRHPLYVGKEGWEVEAGYRAYVQSSIEKRYPAQLRAARGCGAILLGYADQAAQELWPDCPLVEARRRYALQVLAGVYGLLRTADAQFLLLRLKQPDVLTGIRQRYANIASRGGKWRTYRCKWSPAPGATTSDRSMPSATCSTSSAADTTPTPSSSKDPAASAKPL